MCCSGGGAPLRAEHLRRHWQALLLGWQWCHLLHVSNPWLLRNSAHPLATTPQDELPENLANASNTIAWWQSRQAEVQARLNERRAVGGQVRPLAPRRPAPSS